LKILSSKLKKKKKQASPGTK